VFSKAVFLGGGVMAIISGLIGNVLVEGLGMSATAPFDVAILAMLAGGALVASTWPENYGKEGLGSVANQFKAAVGAIAGGEEGRPGLDRKLMGSGKVQKYIQLSTVCVSTMLCPVLPLWYVGRKIARWPC